MNEILKKCSQILPAFMLAVLAASCSDDDKGPSGPQVELSLSSATVDVGGSATADILNVDGNTCTVNVADEFVASAYVLKSELVINAEKVGETTVTVTSGGRNATCNVKVNPTDFCAGSPCLDFGCNQQQLNEAIVEGVKVIDSKDLVNVSYGNISDIYHFRNSKLVCVSTTVVGISEQQLKEYMEQRFNWLHDIVKPSNAYFWYERPGKVMACASPMADGQGWYIRYGANRNIISAYYSVEF